MTKGVFAFIADVMTAMSNCSLYGKGHPAVLHLSEKAQGVLEELYNDDRFTISLLGDSVVINESPFLGRNLHMNSLIKKMRRSGIDKIAITKGVTASELKEFISELALASRITGAYPHIVSGIIEVKLGDGAEADVSAVMRENVGKVKEVFQSVSRFKQLDMVGLEDLVVSFISTIKREQNILKVISPIKSYSEYTYAHNTNVAVLSIFQAESLGFKDDVLHDIGLAGLLHDVGKMFVDKEVLEKTDKLTGSEWEEMQKHPVYGAKYLATLPDIPKYALVAAYEHHMKFNNTGYPKTTRRNGDRQHIISQIISISDFFDALRTDRPYRKSVEVPAIVGLLTEASGKDFNPHLVKNFLRSVKSVTTALS
ncbi:MAG TPA: HD domain-containing phosphohydrolase [Thermodesulfovibrionales bacterium]|nr:HD domain-containing phosphohydrolase [Thermodesulfovibrionales bacterium]